MPWHGNDCPLKLFPLSRCNKIRNILAALAIKLLQCLSTQNRPPPTCFRYFTIRYCSIQGWDQTTSGFGKRMAAILKFYFWLWFWRVYRNRHVILHLLAKFRSNHVAISIFSRWPPAVILDLIWVILSRCQTTVCRPIIKPKSWLADFFSRDFVGR